MKKKLAFFILFIFLLSFVFVNAEENEYEHDDEYYEKMPYIWMTFDYEGAAADMTSDGNPHGVELIDSKEGIIVKMAGEINDPLSDPYFYFPVSHDRLSDIFCEEVQAIALVIKTDVAIKHPDAVNQPELFFRTVQDPTFARVGHPDWTDYFAGNETWAPGTEGYKATDDWQVLVFDMSQNSYWTSIPDRLRLDLFDVCLDVEYVVKGIAFFLQPEHALEWDGDFDRVAFEEEYAKANQPTPAPTAEPTEAPEETEAPKQTESTTKDEKDIDNMTWLYVVIPVAIIVVLVVVFIIVRKRKER
ncbi:MAG TPA: hypothetical protein PLI11_00770 [Clostridia bacterium]|nr:hypothetical protein [Clostridia bacterium]HPZ51429.1 hypothetical protein [Clostridia bacterium]